MAGAARSALIRGRPVKRDAEEGNATVTVVNPRGNSAAAVVDLDDLPDEILVQPDAKRKKAPPKAPGKKQKLAAAAVAQPSERVEGDEDGEGSMGDGNDDGATADVEPEQLDKDDIECSFIESSRIPSHVAKKDYPHRYVEINCQVCILHLHPEVDDGHLLSS